MEEIKVKPDPLMIDHGILKTVDCNVNGTRIIYCENPQTGCVFYIVNGAPVIDECSVERLKQSISRINISNVKLQEKINEAKEKRKAERG